MTYRVERVESVVANLLIYMLLSEIIGWYLLKRVNHRVKAWIPQIRISFIPNNHRSCVNVVSDKLLRTFITSRCKNFLAKKKLKQKWVRHKKINVSILCPLLYLILSYMITVKPFFVSQLAICHDGSTMRVTLYK